MKLKSKQITDSGYTYKYDIIPFFVFPASLRGALMNISNRLEKIEKIIEVDRYEIIREEKAMKINNKEKEDK